MHDEFKFCERLKGCGAWWLRGAQVGFGAFRPEGRGFKSHSSRHLRILGKSFTRSCL